jgi:uncharacterized membrane protein
LFIALPVYSLTFAHHYYKYSGTGSPLALTVLIGLGLLIAASLFFRMRRLAEARADAVEIEFMLWFIVATFLSVAVAFLFPFFASICFNVLLAGLALSFMYLGFIKRSEEIFRLGIIIFFLHVLSKYFDIFWKMMPRSLLFIFGGILLIAGAVFAEKKRREIEEKMHSEAR